MTIRRKAEIKNQLDSKRQKKEKAIFNWSGGKDSAFCLHKILHDPRYEVMCLLTTISQPYQRISMHGVRAELLDIQAERIGLPLVKIQVPEMPTMEVYDNTMAAALMDLKRKGASASVFGDIAVLERSNEEVCSY